MILSQNQTFSDAQVVTVTAPSLNSIDLGVKTVPRLSPMVVATMETDIGPGHEIPILAAVEAAFAGLTSLSVVVQVSWDLTTWVDKAQSTLLLAALKVGKVFPLIVLPSSVARRYLRLNYVVTGGPASAGTINAGIVGGVQINREITG